MERSSNPVLSDRVLSGVRASPSAEVMTIEGTVNKTLISMVILVIVAWWTASDPTMISFAVPAAIVGFILALVICFKPAWAPALTPVYAAAEGCVLGAISLYFETMHSGIVMQALGLTCVTMFTMLFFYKSGYIKATPAFRRGLIIAMCAILVFYLISILSSFFGYHGLVAFYASNSLLSICLSVVIVGIAALNLVLDFNFIESSAAQGNVPKFMEWYGAFALMVTLVWLYIEVIRLLSKLQSRK